MNLDKTKMNLDATKMNLDATQVNLETQIQLRCNLDVMQMQPRCNLDSQLCQWNSYPTFSVRVGWGGVVEVVEDKAISAQPTELELD